MNITTGVAGPAGPDYATQLAQTAQLKRSLNNIGKAIENGNLGSAGAMLTTLAKSHPEYAIPSEATATDNNSGDSINQDFQSVIDALAANNADAAQAGWTKLKSSLAKTGLSINDGTADTAKLVAESKNPMNQTLLSSLFGSNSGDHSLVSTLLGANNSNSANDSVRAAVTSWLTYQANGAGSAIPTPPKSTLDTAG